MNLVRPPGFSSAVLRVALHGALIGLAAILLTVFATWFFFQVDHGRLRTELLKAYEAGVLVDGSGNMNDRVRGDYLFTDCLVFQTLLLGREDWRRSVIVSTIYLDGEPCRRLHDEVAGIQPSVRTYPFSQYVFAARALTGGLVDAFGVGSGKLLLKNLVYLVLLAALGLGCYRLVLTTPQRFTKFVSIGVMACALGLLLLYRLEYYALLFGHGFSELVLASYLLFTISSGGTAERPPIPTAAVVLGVLTGCFDLLTGPSLIAVGLAVLLDYCAAPTGRNPYRRAALVAFACGAGILFALFWQQVLVALLSDERPFLRFATHLALRMQLHRFFHIEYEPEWAFADNLHLYSLSEVASVLQITLPRLTYGSDPGASIVFGSSVLGLVAAILVSQKSARPGCFIAAAVAVSVAAWYVVFAQHTFLHAIFMTRMSVLVPICAAIALSRIALPASWMVSQGVDHPRGKD